MNSSADDKKRWAILPPPSPEASAVSEDIHLDPKAGQLRERIREGRSKESDSPSSGRVSRKASTSAAEPPSATRPKTTPASAPEERAAELRRRYEGSRHSSSIQAIEPSDSDLPTERPLPFSERSPRSRNAQGHRDQETLPAPEWDEE